MTTPEKGVTAPEVSDDQKLAQLEEAEKPVAETTEEPAEPSFEEHDPRKAIYEKSDAIRFGKKPEEETPGEEEPQEAATETPSETTDAKTDAEEQTFTLEEVEQQLGDIKVKVKIDGKEEIVPLSKIARDGVKIPGLESKLTRKAQELAGKEKELTAAEREIAAKFEAAKKPAAPVAPPVTPTTPLRYLTESQVQEQYDSLAVESPYKAGAFLRSVEAERAKAARESSEHRVEKATRDFLDTYEDVQREDWVRMNDPVFYEKHPDIIRAINRANETGDFYPVFVAARSRLVEERLSAQQADVTAKETAKEAEIRKRIDLKKKGQVLRMSTKQETPKPKSETEESPEQSRRKYVAQRALEARQRFGLEPVRK